MEKTLVQNIGLLCTPLGSSVHVGEMQGQMEKTPEACVLMEDGIITRPISPWKRPRGPR